MNFARDCVPGCDFVGDFVGLAGEDLAALFEGFGNSGSVGAEAVWVDAVGELLEDGVGGEEVEDGGGVAIFDGFEVTAGVGEVGGVGHGHHFLPQRTRGTQRESVVRLRYTPFPTCHFFRSLE